MIYSACLSFLVTAELEVLASLDGDLKAHFAVDALHLQHNLLRGFGLETHKKHE